MKLIPIFLLFFVQLNLSSCSVKKQEQLKKATLQSTTNLDSEIDNPIKIDSDGDFLSDQQEKELGLDPYTANYPQMIITQVNEVEAGGRVKQIINGAEISQGIYLKRRYEQPVDVESTVGMIRTKILKLQYITTINPQYLPDEEELAAATDDDLFIVGNWRDKEFYPFKEKLAAEFDIADNSGRITSTFKVGFKNIQYIDEVTNVFLSTNLVNIPFTDISEYRTHPLTTSDTTQEHFFFDNLTEFNSFDNYSITDIVLDTAPIFDYLLKRYSVGLKIKNFQFKRFNKWIDYSILKANIAKKTAKIVFSTPNTTKIYNVTPKGTIEDFLRSILDDVAIDDDFNIIRLANYTNTLSTPVDLEKIPGEELHKGFWILLADATKINTRLQAGKQYIISYATAGELLQSQSFKKKIATNVETVSLDKTGYKVSNLKAGDKLEFSITATRQQPTTTDKVVSHTCRIREWEVGGYDEPSSDTTFNGTCRTVRKVTNGFSAAQALKIDISKIRICIGNKDYNVAELTEANNPPVTYVNGYKLAFSINLKSHILDNNENIFIKILPTKTKTPVKLGFVRYHSPEQFSYGRGGRSVSNYPTDSVMKRLTFKDTLTINILRTGIDR